MDPIFWRLIYADDHNEDEPLSNASIRLSHKGAVMLQACVYEPDQHGHDLRRAVFQVRLVDVAEDDGRFYTPVFYRIRSLDLMADGSQHQATVVGRARDGDNDVEGTLWLTRDGVTFEDCPEWAFDKEAINGLLVGA